PVAAGHRAGTKALRRTVEAAIDLGVESVCVFAFSTENWSRPPEEVDALMEIFVETIERELPDLAKQGVATRFIGRRDRANPELQERMARLEEETSHNERLQLWIAFDYGGAAETFRPRGGWSRRGSTRVTSTKTQSPRGSTHPRCPSPTF